MLHLPKYIGKYWLVHARVILCLGKGVPWHSDFGFRLTWISLFVVIFRVSRVYTIKQSFRCTAHITAIEVKLQKGDSQWMSRVQEMSGDNQYFLTGMSKPYFGGCLSSASKAHVMLRCATYISLPTCGCCDIRYGSHQTFQSFNTGWSRLTQENRLTLSTS